VILSFQQISDAHESAAVDGIGCSSPPAHREHPVDVSVPPTRRFDASNRVSHLNRGLLSSAPTHPLKCEIKNKIDSVLTCAGTRLEHYWRGLSQELGILIGDSAKQVQSTSRKPGPDGWLEQVLRKQSDKLSNWQWSTVHLLVVPSTLYSVRVPQSKTPVSEARLRSCSKTNSGSSPEVFCRLDCSPGGRGPELEVKEADIYPSIFKPVLSKIFSKLSRYFMKTDSAAHPRQIVFKQKSCVESVCQRRQVK
jgi:hypothetical protein